MEMQNMEENTQQSVKFVPAVCPKCGGQLEVDPAQEAAVCKYCGTPFIVEKAIQQYTVQNAHIDHVDKVTVDVKGSVDSVVGMIERQLDKNREESREDKRIRSEESKEFLKSSWKIMLVLFAALIVFWLLSNWLGFFN